MKKLKKLKLNEVSGFSELDCRQMRSITGGYDWGGDVIYHAYAVNPSGSTMHHFSDTSSALVDAWAHAWIAAGWSVRIEIEYRNSEPKLPYPYLYV